MASAKKLKSGSWRCLAYIGKDKEGKRLYKSFTAPTKKEAELLALSYVEEEKSPEQIEITLGEAVDQYIDLKSNILSVSTVRGYKKISKYYPDLFAMNVSEVTSTVLQSYINKEARKLSTKTLKNRFGLIRSVLKEHEPEKAFKLKYPQRVIPDIQIPSSDEVALMWEFAKGTDMELPILLGAYVGMRRSEICAVDRVKNGMIPVNKVVLLNESREWVIQDRAKTEAGNRLAYPPAFVMELIKKTKLPIGLNPNQISDRFRKITRKLNLPDYRFHDLRHFYASALMSAHVPDKYVMERIGHSTDYMLKTIYQHTMKEKNKEINHIIDNIFAPMQHEMQHEA